MQILLKDTHPYRLLQRESSHGGLSHAYLLLCNDEEILRESLRFFAKSFFSQEDRVLSLIDRESFCDCLFFPKVGKKLSVEDATTIVEESSVRPLEGEKKVFVIDGFHTASPAVQNKLLKILEEPPHGVHFLLGATSEFSLLPTVLSRVKKLELSPFSVAQLQEYLQRNYPAFSKEEISFFAAAACGKLSSAKAFTGNSFYKEMMEDGLKLTFASFSELPALCKKIGEKGRKENLLSVLEILFRDAAFKGAKNGLDAYLLSPFYEKELQKIVDLYPLGVLLSFQKQIREAQKQIKFNANFTQCLQMLFVWLAENRKK